jgi:hypothetical protein
VQVENHSTMLLAFLKPHTQTPHAPHSTGDLPTASALG